MVCTMFNSSSDYVLKLISCVTTFSSCSCVCSVLLRSNLNNNQSLHGGSGVELS